jgi:hypothetical protein
MNINENVYLRIAYLSGYNMGGYLTHLWARHIDTAERVINYGDFIDKWKGAMIYDKSLFCQVMCLGRALSGEPHISATRISSSLCL